MRRAVAVLFILLATGGAYVLWTGLEGSYDESNDDRRAKAQTTAVVGGVTLALSALALAVLLLLTRDPELDRLRAEVERLRADLAFRDARPTGETRLVALPPREPAPPSRGIDPDRRRLEVEALGGDDVAADPAETEAALRAALEDPDRGVRTGAALAYYRRTGDAGRPTEVLAELAASEDTWTRWLAIDALVAMGPAGKDALPVVVRSLRDPDESLRARAADVIEALGPDAAVAVPALVEQIRLGPRLDRARAADLLASIGEPARSAVNVLESAAEDRRPEVRDAARRALALLNESASPTPP